MIEEKLLDFGAIGLFAAYMIYDKQVMMKKIIEVLNRIATKVEKCEK